MTASLTSLATKSVLPVIRPIPGKCLTEVWTPAADGWTSGKLPGLPGIGVVDVWRLDADEADSNGDLLANVQDPVTPASLMLIEGIAAPVVLKRAPRTFSADGLVERLLSMPFGAIRATETFLQKGIRRGTVRKLRKAFYDRAMRRLKISAVVNFVEFFLPAVINLKFIGNSIY